VVSEAIRWNEAEGLPRFAFYYSLNFPHRTVYNQFTDSTLELTWCTSCNLLLSPNSSDNVRELPYKRTNFYTVYRLDLVVRFSKYYTNYLKTVSKQDCANI